MRSFSTIGYKLHKQTKLWNSVLIPVKMVMAISVMAITKHYGIRLNLTIVCNFKCMLYAQKEKKNMQNKMGDQI